MRYSLLVRCLVGCLVSCLVACGPSPSSPKDANISDDDAKPIDASTPTIDYNAGTWESEVAVDTAGTISHDPTGVFTNDGTLWGTWMEPEVDATSGEDIWEMKLPRGGAWAVNRITDDGAAQAAYNQMATDGTTVHLVYNSRTGNDNDVFYTKHDGAQWRARLDVTTPAEPTPRHDFQTDIALAPNGDALIAYVSASVSQNGGIASDGEIRVARIAGNGTVSGMPQVAIPTVAPHGCFDPAIVVDKDGTVHVAADCGAIGAEEVLYTSSSGGDFAAPVPFPGGGARDDRGVQLALDPDGLTLHAVWTADAGDAECVYAQKPPGGSWTSSISASNEPAANDHSCVLAVDSAGRPLAAWHRPNANNAEDILFAWSSDGTTFETARVVTPGTDTTTEWFADVIAIEPATGAVHILYEHLVPMTNPLNTQIMHAWLAP